MPFTPETVLDVHARPMHVERHVASLALSERTGEQMRLTQLHFLYWEHTREHADELMNAIGDADIVGIEFVISENKLQDYEALANKASATDDAVDLTEIKEVHGLVGEVIERLRGSRKQIRFIDVSEEIYAANMQSQVEGDEYIYDNMFSLPVAETQNLIIQQTAESARENGLREKVVNGQIDQLILENPGKKITVVEGVVHTPTFHAPRDSEVLVSRTFVPEGQGINTGMTELVLWALHIGL